MKVSKKVWVLLAIATILIAARLYLPRVVTRHVNNTLDSIPGYSYTLEDITIHLYKGAYQLKELRIFKDGQTDTPFIYIPSLDLSIEWGALLDAAVVGQVSFEDPELNFVRGEKDQNGIDIDWSVPMQRLMPFKINRIKVVNGKIRFYDLNTEPHAEFALNNVNASAENLLNITEDTGVLPSSAHLTAVSSGEGTLGIKIKMNVLKPVPDLEIDLKFDNADLKGFSNFLEAYPKVAIQEGKFNLYTKAVMLDGKAEGYIVPVIEGLSNIRESNNREKPMRPGWESIGDFLLANQSKDRFTSRVPLAGTMKAGETAVLPALWNVLSEAFVKAFEIKREGTVKLKTVRNEDSGIIKKIEKQQKKDERKERRKKRREERKKKNES